MTRSHFRGGLVKFIIPFINSGRERSNEERGKSSEQILSCAVKTNLYFLVFPAMYLLSSSFISVVIPGNSKEENAPQKHIFMYNIGISQFEKVLLSFLKLYIYYFLVDVRAFSSDSLHGFNFMETRTTGLKATE